MAEDETLPARRFRQRFDEIGLSELSVIGADASASSILSGKCRESALGARPRSNCWAGGRIAAAPTHHVRRATAAALDVRRRLDRFGLALVSKRGGERTPYRRNGRRKRVVVSAVSDERVRNEVSPARSKGRHGRPVTGAPGWRARWSRRLDGQ